VILIRPLLPVLAALALAAPALAENAPAQIAEGSIVGLSSTSISFRSDGGNAFTCSVAPTQGASLGALHLAPGLRVKVACRIDGGRLVLVGVKRLEVKPVTPPVTTPPATPVKNTYGRGAVTALSTASITVGTDGVPITCSLTPAQASSLAAVARVGQRVKIACRQDGDHLLFVAIAPDETVAPPVKNTYGRGAVTALSTASITVGSDGAPITCSLTPAQASSLAAVARVGQRVKIACRQDGDHLLFVAIAPDETVAPKPAPVTTAPPTTAAPVTTAPPTAATPAPATVREVSGTLTAIRNDALVLAGEGGVSLTCLFNSELAPKVAALNLAVGTRVHVVCKAYGDRAYLTAISKP
jgi:regulator of extracellular matrix RemA (YlzA/DUF370 family)